MPETPRATCRGRGQATPTRAGLYQGAWPGRERWMLGLVVSARKMAVGEGQHPCPLEQDFPR